MYPLCDYFFWREGGGGRKENLLLNVIKMGKKQSANVNRALANYSKISFLPWRNSSFAGLK